MSRLSSVISLYLSCKKSLGYRFVTEENVLNAFCKAMGDSPMNGIEAARVLAFLNGSGLVSEYWVKKYNVLSGFYRFALSRGFVAQSPLPHRIPLRTAPVFMPYIYSEDELRKLFAACTAACPGRCHVEGDVLRAMLVLLYGATLRLGEALSLTIADVDVSESLLRVRETKFFNYAEFMAMPIRQRLDRDDACKEPSGRHSQVAWFSIVFMAKDPRNVAKFLSGRSGFVLLSRGFDISENGPPLRPSQKRA